MFYIFRMIIRCQLRAHGSKLITEAQSIESKRNRLQRLINAFESQAEFFLHLYPTDDSPISALGDYEEFDMAGNPHHLNDTDPEHAEPSYYIHPNPSDVSWIESPNPEYIQLLLPSSLGLEWCIGHGVQYLAVREAHLRHSQANDAIHNIRLGLGYKSALFRTHVRPAKTQKSKTCAWNAIHNVDTSIQEHARIYAMARDAYQELQNVYPSGLNLPQLSPDDLHVATLVLGSEKRGQRNTQQSWIWGFGKASDDDGTWMHDCKPFMYFSYIHVLTHHITQLTGCTGSVLKHNLKGGWKSKTAYIMKLIGFLPTFILRQRYGGILCSLLHRGRSKGMKHMHHIRCILGRSFLKALPMPFLLLPSLH
jgi:hypothetical protein